MQVYLEDAGFDWKILGPDVQNVDYVAWQCDQDAYACSGQKCSAESILFMHENWRKAGRTCQVLGHKCAQCPTYGILRQPEHMPAAGRGTVQKVGTGLHFTLCGMAV